MYNELQKSFLDGQTFIIDKPYEWTSFDVVNKLKWTLLRTLKLKKIKVGHAGTLDPLATGLLIVCVGKHTKRISELQSEIKEYTGTIKLGATTPSFDLETEIGQEFDCSKITTEQAKDAALKLTGILDQMPPLFSAKKVDGKRAYDAARAGKTVELKPNKIEVESFEITRFELPEVDFKIVCSKGTYIRALARDFGELLNNGAHLTVLRRTKRGNFSVENALTVDEAVEKIQATAS